MRAVTPLPRLVPLSRWLLLLALAALTASVGPAGSGVPGSLQMLAQASAVVLLALLLAPRPTPGAPAVTATRAVLAWGAGAGLATAVLLILRFPSLTVVGTVATLTLGVGVLTLLAGSLQVGLAALLGDRRWASRLVVLIYLVLGAAPLWLGPAAELFAERQAVVDGVIALSPLSYLGVLADVDYLRSDWFYRHTAFGSLRYAYPAALGLTAAYLALAAAALSLGPWLARRGRADVVAAVPCPSTT